MQSRHGTPRSLCQRNRQLGAAPRARRTRYQRQDVEASSAHCKPIDAPCDRDRKGAGEPRRRPGDLRVECLTFRRWFASDEEYAVAFACLCDDDIFAWFLCTGDNLDGVARRLSAATFGEFCTASDERSCLFGLACTFSR